MKASQLTTLALRVLAVYVGIRGMLYVTQAVTMMPPVGGLSVYGGMVMMGLPTVLGVVLWIVAPALGRWATHGLDQVSTSSSLSVETLTTSAFVVVGVVILLLAIPGLISVLYQGVVSPTSLPNLAWPLGRVVQSLLALGLIIWAPSLATWQHR